MTISLARMLVTLVTVFPMPAIAAGLPPWQFGMSKAKVVSFAAFGPYRTFKNGDVETFNGRFHGHKENIQFFFDRTGLCRIGVYMFEGKDVKQGIPAWRRAYELLQKDYGKVATPDIHVAPNSAPFLANVLAIAAASNADVTGQTQMAPVKQPNDTRVFARFWAGYVRGAKWFYVAVFLDPSP